MSGGLTLSCVLSAIIVLVFVETTEQMALRIGAADAAILDPEMKKARAHGRFQAAATLNPGEEHLASIPLMVIAGEVLGAQDTGAAQVVVEHSVGELEHGWRIMACDQAARLALTKDRLAPGRVMTTLALQHRCLAHRIRSSAQHCWVRA